MRQQSRAHDERGAVALLMAISMVGLCVAAAMVVDLGLLRVDRQTDKSAQDAAAVAGANGLVTSLNSPVPFHPFAGVCQALNYLKVNSSDLNTFSSEVWENGNGASLGGPGYGCTSAAANLSCAASPTTWARVTGTTREGKTVIIQSGYTVSGGNIASVTGGDFPEESLPAFSTDTGNATYAGCDQIAVFIFEHRPTTLGNAASVSSMGTRVRSVARVHIDPPKSPFALLLLERHDCQVLANTSNGTIDVTGYKTNPALIHLDSVGDGDGCNKPVILGVKSGGVVAHEAPLPAGAGAPGEISTVATGNQSDGIPNVYAGPFPPGANPTSSGQVSREVLDTIYLEHVRAAKNAAKPFLTATTVAGLPALPSPATWAVKGPCNQAITGNEEYVFVDCNDVGKDVTLPNAKVVVFRGSVSGDNIQLPVATRVYVGGQSTPAKGITVGSNFSMNDGGLACPTAYDTSKNRARLILLNSDLKATGGTFRACNTTIMLLGGDIDGCLPTSPGTYYDDGKVCPGGSTGTGFLTLGGNTNIDWTAPDTINDDLPSDDPANVAGRADLEDLALWTETYGTHTLGGGGTMHLMGVFAAPNAHDMKLNGGPTQNVKNSQYIVRSLQTTGSGALQMTPLPSLPVAPPTVTFELVR